MEDTPPRQPWETPDQPERPDQGQAPGYGAPPAPPPGWGTPAEPPPAPAPPAWGPAQDAPPAHGWDPPSPAQGWGAPPTQGQGWGAPPAAPGWGQGPGQLPLRPKPGIIPLRPISLGEMYDGAFQAMRSNPRTMVGISAVVIAVTTLLSLVPQTAAMVSLTRFSETAAENASADPSIEDLATLGTFTGGTLIGAVLSWVGVTVLTGLLIVAVSEAVLGRRIGAGEVWQRTKGRVWALLGLTLLSGVLLVLAMALVVLLGIVLGAVVHPALGIVVGGVLFLAVSIRVYVGLSMASPALLLEGKGVTAALRRSWGLTKGSGTFWRVFGILALTSIIVAIASSLIVLPLSLVTTVITLGSGSEPGTQALVLQSVVSQLGSGVASAIFAPFQAAVSALLYIDLRMRREGLDVELIKAAEGARG